MANDYIGRYSGAKIDELLQKADTSVYTKAETDALLSGKVDSAAGMGLSQENYTTAEKTKLSSLENYDDTALSAQISAAVDSGAKNRFKGRYTQTSARGIDFTCQPDGSYLLSGTAEATFSKTNFAVLEDLSELIGKRVKLTGGLSSSIRLGVYTSRTASTPVYTDSGQGVEFTFTEEMVTAPYDIRVIINGGTVCDGEVIRPMLREAVYTDDTYVPFAYSNPALTALISDLTARVEALENA